MKLCMTLLEVLRVVITVIGVYLMVNAISSRERRDGWRWELMSGIELIVIALLLMAGFGI